MPSLCVNPLNAELNPICHLVALLGGATIVVVSRLRVNSELVKFNRQLTKYMKIHNNVKILEVNFDTECSIKRDQHLNVSWKEHISCCCH